MKLKTLVVEDIPFWTLRIFSVCCVLWFLFWLFGSGPYIKKGYMLYGVGTHALYAKSNIGFGVVALLIPAIFHSVTWIVTSIKIAFATITRKELHVSHDITVNIRLFQEVNELINLPLLLPRARKDNLLLAMLVILVWILISSYIGWVQMGIFQTVFAVMGIFFLYQKDVSEKIRLIKTIFISLLILDGLYALFAVVAIGVNLISMFFVMMSILTVFVGVVMVVATYSNLLIRIYSEFRTDTLREFLKKVFLFTSV